MVRGDAHEQLEFLTPAPGGPLLDAIERVGEMGAWSYDARGHTLEWSSGLYRLFGMEPRVAPPTEAEFLTLVHPDDRERVEASNRSLCEQRNGAPVSVKFRLVPSNNGKSHTFEATSH